MPSGMGDLPAGKRTAPRPLSGAAVKKKPLGRGWLGQASYTK